MAGGIRPVQNALPQLRSLAPIMDLEATPMGLNRNNLVSIRQLPEELPMNDHYLGSESSADPFQAMERVRSMFVDMGAAAQAETLMHMMQTAILQGLLLCP